MRQTPSVTDVRRTSAIAAVLVATAIWSFGGVLAKAAGTTGIVTTFWRAWMATILLGAIAVARQSLPTAAELRRSLLAGVLFGTNLCLFFSALESISIASALVIASLTPVGMLPIAVLMLGERLTPAKVGCALVAVGAAVVAVLAAPQATAGQRSTALGFVLVSLAIVVWLAYLTAAKQVRKSVRTIPFMFSITATTAVIMTPAMLLRGNGGTPSDSTGWLWLLLLAIGPGISGHGLVVWAQDKIDASVSAVLMQAEPVGATIAAYFLLHEQVSLVQALAMAVVVAALCLLMLREARAVNAPPSPRRSGWPRPSGTRHRRCTGNT